jgi:hypothetical protein
VSRVLVLFGICLLATAQALGNRSISLPLRITGGLSLTPVLCLLFALYQALVPLISVLRATPASNANPDRPGAAVIRCVPLPPHAAAVRAEPRSSAATECPSELNWT